MYEITEYAFKHFDFSESINQKAIFSSEGCMSTLIKKTMHLQ